MADERAKGNGSPGTTVEQFSEFVNRLAAQYGQASSHETGQEVSARLSAYKTWLDEAHAYFRDSSREEITLTYTSEWVLDNYYIIRQTLRQMDEDLPAGYYARLPKLAGGPYKGFPRIYAITREVLAYRGLLFNLEDVQGILIELQERIPLTMGELWAVPIFLRYGLIEVLSFALKSTLEGQIKPSISLPLLPAPADAGEEAGKNENEQAKDTSNRVANAVLSLRVLSEQDWNEFFDNTSRVERTLRQDPLGVYPLMDFKSRDVYRKKIEQLATTSGRTENDLADIVVELAQEGQHKNGDEGPQATRRAHVGYYLLSDGRRALESRIGFRPTGGQALRRWLARYSSALYLGSIFVLTALFLILFLLPVNHRASILVTVLFGVLLLIPAVTIATSLVNWLATMITAPRILPKISFREEIPASYRTLVTIPALLTRGQEVDSLVRQIEMHYLRNPETGLLFALLTDFSDADQETLPEDDALVEQAAKGIEALNDLYQRENGERPFFLLHRPRVWNPREGKWMGWERKRGKLHQLNQLLLGKNGRDHFSNLTGELDLLKGVQFVITLDADTMLPRGAARRMVGALAHPLNRPIFDERTRQVVSGYTVLQPRMEISPISANQSWFTRIFAGDSGLDLYTLAVSDAYQDLFAEGIYVGKGIYDVAGFERSVEGRIPENTLLSHDLLEGLMGRAGLVTDITMVEDYPPTYFAQMQRQKRWIRGDWQLLPWLLLPGRFGLHFSAVDRWKIIDNLRRSLLFPSLLILFLAGIFWLPGLAWVWTLVILLATGIPLLTGLFRGMQQAVGGEIPSTAFHSLKMDGLRWALAIAFLPYEAYEAVDAILLTLYRLIISRRHLLQWTTAARAAQLFGASAQGSLAWRKMGFATIFAIALTGILSWRSPAALYAAAPVLLLWLASPVVARWINLPAQRLIAELTGEQAALLRRVARRTWSFFERFVGPEDHWLPPDHFQESPLGLVAHRTSPTNIGLLLNSTLAAYDFGYLDPISLSTRLDATMDTLDRMERFRGHFLNWYDTQTLQRLNPGYVSTVDSGNLAASLVILAQACKAMPDEPVFRWELWQGFMDTYSILKETLTDLHSRGSASRTGNGSAAKPFTDIEATRPTDAIRQVVEIEEQIEAMFAEILNAREDPGRWYPLFRKASGPFWEDISSRLASLIVTGRPVFDLESLRRLQEGAAQVARFHTAVQRTITDLTPWIPLLENVPAPLKSESYKEQLAELYQALTYSPKLGHISQIVVQAQERISWLRERLDLVEEPAGEVVEGAAGSPAPAKAVLPAVEHPADTGLAWLDSLENAVTHSADAANALLEAFASVARRSEAYVEGMNFKFLYHPLRQIFHIGYNIESGQLDNNYYDLLASEARIASIVAIARREVPVSHWLHLSRPVTEVEGHRVLLSWSATMFEYLMPPLYLPLYPGTLLTESTYGAVEHQIAYGKSKGVPWGISESGFYRFDSNQSYQYRAFGVPGLGFKRGLGDDLVIAPYASLMAVGYDPLAVVQNIADMIRHKALGLWGFYEAIDFTTDRLLVGETSAVVKEYMAHHQGMILLALDNFFKNNIMVQRMTGDPYIQSMDLLLQEKVPLATAVQGTYTEDVKGVQRAQTSDVEIVHPWTVPVQTPVPQVSLLSNGSYSVLISNSGGGYSTWRDTDLTRWQPDGVLDPWGTWIYLEDLDEPKPDSPPKRWDPNLRLWSAGFQPVPGDPNDTQVTYFAHMAVLHRKQRGINSTMEIVIAPDDPVEIRRLTINNAADRPRRIRLTSYGEVILNKQSADTRHPAFNKLFIESEWIESLNLQIYKRRPRSESEAPVYMGHMLLHGEDLVPTLAHEADRARFIGRGGSPQLPAALASPSYLSGTSGATLDPIFALGQEAAVGVHQTIRVAYITLAAESREDILALAERYHNWSQVDRSFHHADRNVQAWLGRHNIDTQAYQSISQVLSALVYPLPAARAQAQVIAANRLGQSGLWRFGISGDYPVMLVQIDDANQLDLVRELLQVHRFLRSRRFMADLVILNGQQTNYGAELNGMIYRLVSRVNSEQWLNQRGGIFILYADQMQPEEDTLLRTSARMLLSGTRGALADQLPGYAIQVPHLPELVPTRASSPVETTPQPTQEDLQFFNGYGGFSADGREYIIRTPTGRRTPAPWANVIGYPQFGFLVTEAGSQSTWAVNSGENRLSPWLNDPVRDPTGEALYLRDEETGEVWTPTPLPSGEDVPFEVRHGAGYTIFEHESHGLHQRLTLFASPEDPVKLVHLVVKNTSEQVRRITATQYVEWVLGTTHSQSQPYLIPEYDTNRECLLVSNPYNSEFAGRVAFLASSKRIHGVTMDRTEFLGRNGSLAFPIALRRLGLETRVTAGEDTCGVLQVHMDLPPGGGEEIYFLIGQGNSREHALALVDKYHEGGYVGAAWQQTQVFWDRLLDTIQVQTPEPAMNLVLNRWLLYQALSCRIWGRTAFYQSSGAFGFRDQLQDVLALISVDPAVARNQILNAAIRQFEQGDVLHWWHPPSGRGVRTRFSDDLLWLPYVTAQYVDATGDTAILREKIPFLSAPELKPGEDERYGYYTSTAETFTLLEHCRRAIERGTTNGPHQLPLIGTGDWNDGYNRVGVEGKGESIWLAWFLCDVLDRFANLCERVQGEPDQQIPPELPETYRARARDYAAAVEKSAWDGAWYRRAYYDDGAPLGSKTDQECKIDAIAQSWSVISGAGDPERSKRAMQSTLERLVRPEHRLSLLFTPPFDQTPHDPGYIKGYLPGIRENGGQYTHAAIWTAWAFTRLGDSDQAMKLFRLLNPVLMAPSREMAEDYRVEPYVVCADIYSVEPYLRRGGWTWYTGSAAWMYRLGVEAILGLRRKGDLLVIDPVIPSAWDGFSVNYRSGETIYQIKVNNPRRVARGIRQVTVDGEVQQNRAISLVDDGKPHLVTVEMG